MRPPRSGGKTADGRFKTTRKYISAAGFEVRKEFVQRKGESIKSVVQRADLWQAENRGKIPSPNMTLSLAIDTWLYHRDAKLSAATKLDYRQALARFGHENTRIDHITVYMVETEIAKWADTPRSAQKIRTVGRALFNWLQKMKWASENPFKDADPVSYQPPQWEEPVTEEYIEKVIRATKSDQFRAMFLLLYRTGVRPDAARNLMWSDLEKREDGWWFTRGSKTSASRKPVPLPESVALAVLSLPRTSLFVFPGRSGKPLHPSSAGHVWRKSVVLAGFDADSSSLYDLRHYFATRLRRSGVDKALRTRLMGHTKDAVAEMFYDQFSESEVRRALEK